MRLMEAPVLRFFKKMSVIKTVSAIIILIISIYPASAGTTIALDKTIDIPDRTIIYQSKNYEIQDIGAYHIGDIVNISVNVTDIKSFQLLLMDMNKNFLWNQMVYYTDGKTDLIMPADVVGMPGTYAFAILYQGDIIAIKPVVFSRYTLSVIPESVIVTPNSTLHVKVRVSPESSLPLKIALAKNSSGLESVVNRSVLGIYEAEIKIPPGANGNFSLYAALVSNNIVLGYPELIGVSSGGIITVSQNPPSIDNTFENKYKSTPSIAAVFLIGILLIVFKRLRS